MSFSLLPADHTGMLGFQSPLYGSPSSSYGSAVMQQQMLDLVRSANMRQAQPYVNLASNLLSGGNMGSLSPNVQYALSNLGGLAAAQGLLGGGSAGIQMLGIAQAVGGGGFHVGGASSTMTARMYGQGGLTTHFTKQLYDQVEDHFFGGLAGAQLHRTHGLSRTDIGNVFQQLQQRGAFAGMEIGSLDIDVQSGKTVGKLNDRTADRIKEFIEDAAGTLGSLREIFGDQSMDKLMSEAERISGMGFRSPQSARAIRGRIESAKIQAQMFGMDTRAYMEFDYATSANTAQAMAALQGGRPEEHYRSAAAMTPHITRNSGLRHRENQETANREAARGRYLDARTQEEIAEFTSRSVAKIEAFERPMLAAYFMADAYGMGNEDRMQLDALRDKWATAEGADARQAARNEMRDFMLEKTGLDINVVGRAKSVEDMKRKMTDSTLSGLGEAYMKREMASSVTSFNRIQKMLGSEASGAELHKFFTTFGADTRDKFYDYMETGAGYASLEDFMQKNDLTGLGMSAQEVRNLMMKENGVRDLRRTEVEVQTRRDLQNLGSKEGIRQGWRDYASNYMANNAYGGGQARIGFMEMIDQALGGKIQVKNHMLLSYGRERMAGEIADVGWNEQTGAMVLDDAGKAQMLKVMEDSGVDFARMMDTKSTEEAFAMLETAEGFGKFSSKVEGTGMVLGMRYDKSGNVEGWSLGSSKLKKEGTKEIEDIAARKREMALLGFEDDAAYDSFVAAEKERLVKKGYARDNVDEVYNETQFERLMENHQSLADNIDAFLHDRTKGRGKVAAEFFEANSAAMIPMLTRQAEELEQQAKGQKGLEKQETLNQIDKIKSLRDSLIRSGGNNYIGHMTTDMGYGLAVYSTDGGGKEGLDRSTS